jgi:hypothetical protein
MDRSVLHCITFPIAVKPLACCLFPAGLQRLRGIALSRIWQPSFFLGCLSFVTRLGCFSSSSLLLERPDRSNEFERARSSLSMRSCHREAFEGFPNWTVTLGSCGCRLRDDSVWSSFAQSGNRHQAKLVSNKTVVRKKVQRHSLRFYW